MFLVYGTGQVAEILDCYAEDHFEYLIGTIAGIDECHDLLISQFAFFDNQQPGEDTQSFQYFIGNNLTCTNCGDRRLIEFLKPGEGAVTGDTIGTFIINAGGALNNFAFKRGQAGCGEMLMGGRRFSDL